MPKGEHPADPRGLIQEAFAMDLSAEDARTIFLDWALGPEAGPGAPAALLAHYADQHPGHPMTALLRDAAAAGAQAPPIRRGGRRKR